MRRCPGGRARLIAILTGGEVRTARWNADRDERDPSRSGDGRIRMDATSPTHESSTSRVWFLQTAESSGGAVHEQRVECLPGSPFPPSNLHPAQDEHFEVEQDRMLFVIDGAEVIVRARETLDIPRGTVHRARSASETETAVVRWEPRTCGPRTGRCAMSVAAPVSCSRPYGTSCPAWRAPCSICRRWSRARYRIRGRRPAAAMRHARAGRVRHLPADGGARPRRPGAWDRGVRRARTDGRPPP